MEEKRKSKRIDLDCKLVLKRLDRGDAGAAREVSVHVLDVSKTGIGFECPEKLSIGGVYECYLTIWTKETIHSFVQVVRALKKDDSSSKIRTCASCGRHIVLLDGFTCKRCRKFVCMDCSLNYLF